VRPYLFSTFGSYRPKDFQSDLGAGITVGLVALPLALAIGIASGVKPENGLITGIVGGAIVSILGGARLQIGGPAAAFIGLVYATVANYGFNGLVIALMMSGLLMLLMGLLKVGNLLRFVPDSVVVGFTNGIALLIVAAQLKSLLGLEALKFPGDIWGQLQVVGGASEKINLTTLLLGLVCLGMLIKWPPAIVQRTKLPSTICMLFLGSALAPLASMCGGEKIATIGSEFGKLDAQLLAFNLPSFNDSNLLALLGPAISLAILGAIESLLCARLADDVYAKQHGLVRPERHDSNQELIGQGVANIITPLFGGIATTGTIARTVTNIKSGGSSPWAGVIHALTLLLFLLIAAPLARYIPMTVLAAILLWVSWNMFDLTFHMTGLTINNTTASITLVLTLTAGLAWAVLIGVAVYWAIHTQMRSKDL
jgi:sulfate permease, SulP family